MPPIFLQPRLTELELTEVAQRLASRTDIRRLATKLGVASHDIQGALNSHQTIVDAALDVLHRWRDSQTDAMRARRALKSALEATPFHRIFAEVFGDRDGKSTSSKQVNHENHFFS